jgi:hypothetical protein
MGRGKPPLLSFAYFILVLEVLRKVFSKSLVDILKLLQILIILQVGPGSSPTMMTDYQHLCFSNLKA